VTRPDPSPQPQDPPFDSRPARFSHTLHRITAHLVWLISCVLGDDPIGRRLRRRVLSACGARIHPSARIHGGSFWTRPAHLTVGAGTFINRHCYFDLEGEIMVGERVTVGHGVTFITTSHQLGPPSQRCGPWHGVPTTIEDGAWIGAGATILPGITIGRGAVVGAGSVVTRSVDDGQTVAGNPARPTNQPRNRTEST
jgi:acetyltransferase-like isoleucine patch superfamily enzyme